MAKEIKRCGWEGTKHADYIRYHDEEWGVPVRDDHKQFEYLILEGAQAGLSWWTILSRRENYRRAFANFDPQVVARFTAKRVERLMNDAGIIRNRLKILAAVSNAKAFLEIQEEFGTFCDYIWDFVGGRPIKNRWKTLSEIPPTSEISDLLSRDLKQRGFKFVGSTVIYAHMQATGMVNDHVVDCFRHSTV
jgi:DNA-3-methyladenine glycosylase I